MATKRTDRVDGDLTDSSFELCEDQSEASSDSEQEIIGEFEALTINQPDLEEKE